MSLLPQHGLSIAGRSLFTMIALVAMLALSSGRFATVNAQDATPASGDCVAPEVPPGTPTADAAAAPPVMEEEGPEVASPAAGTAADQTTADQIEAAVENYIACYNTLDATNFVPLSTEAHRVAEYDAANLYDAIANASVLPAYETPGAELVSLENVMTYDDGRVSADVEVLQGGHWFLHLRQFFVQEGEHWLIDEDEVLVPAPEGEATSAGVTVVEHTITPDVTEIEQSPVVIFNIQVAPEATESHMTIVIKLPEGTDPTGLLDGTVTPDQLTFYGGVFDLGAGDTEALALVDLEPGVYTLVSFGGAADGTTHIELGMYSTVTITASAG